MCGWHNNYNNFTSENGVKGTIVYANGSLSIFFENNKGEKPMKDVFSISTEDLINQCMEKLKNDAQS